MEGKYRVSKAEIPQNHLNDDLSENYNKITSKFDD